MSKATSVGIERVQIASPTPISRSSRASDATPLRELERFLARYGLSHKREVFQKAALLLDSDVNDGQVLSLTNVERQALELETIQKWRQSRALYFTIFVCALGAIEQGWAQTSINGANPYIGEAFNFQTNHGTKGYVFLGWINCAMYLSNAFIGSWLSGPVNNVWGRRGAIFFGTALCIVGNVGAGLLPKLRPRPDWSPRPIWYHLFACRFVLGIGLGLNASTVSVLAAESAPAYIRGGLAVCWQMFVAFGILLGFLANLALWYVGRDRDFRVNVVWRLQLAAPLLAAIPLLVLVYSCPESPAWHIKQGRYDRAFLSLRRLRNTELQAASELWATHLAQQSEDVPVSFKRWSSLVLDPLKSFSSLFKKARNRHALLGSYTVMLSQQLCGINIIAFYSTTIFAGPGNSVQSALWASMVFGLVNFLGAFPAVWSMDTLGRRTLLLWTLPAMALIMAFAAASFNIPSGTNGVQFTLLAALIYLFCAIYSPGMGPVPCAYSAEVYPLDVREVGMSLAISTANFWAMVLSLSFPMLLAAYGQQRVFSLYAGLNVLAWVLCWMFVRETKGIRLEEMDSVFESSPLAFIHGKWRQGLRGVGEEITRKGNFKRLRQEDTED